VGVMYTLYQATASLLYVLHWNFIYTHCARASPTYTRHSDYIGLIHLCLQDRRVFNADGATPWKEGSTTKRPMGYPVSSARHWCPVRQIFGCAKAQRVGDIQEYRFFRQKTGVKVEM